jgi:HEPN domain-containing protein
VDEKIKEAISQWKIKADNDLKIVSRNIDDMDPVTDVLSFHCQQSAEKYLKLFLASREVEPKRTHDIAFLIGECIKIDPDFENILSASFLSVYAVESRYIDDFYIPSIDELRKAYKAALSVKEFVVSKIR